MAVKKLSELTALTTAADGDLMLINDISEASDADKPKRITAANLKSYMAADVIAAVGLLDGLGFSPQLRLTAVSGNPAHSDDTVSVGTLYYSPHTGNAIQLYNGVNWEVFELAELSLALTLVSGKNYDVFVDYNAGTPVLALSAAWTSDNVRADALGRQNGRIVKTDDTGQLYVGTIRAYDTDVTADSAQFRYIYNHYNKMRKICQITGLTKAAANYVYFMIGDPTGAPVTIGVNGSFKTGGGISTNQYADVYVFSNLIPSTAPGHFEVGLKFASSDALLTYQWMGRSQVVHFLTGYNYIKFNPIVAGTQSDITNGAIYADMEM